MNEENNEITLKECSQVCLDKDVSCDFKECNSWINFAEDQNCDLISIKKHGQLTLRQVGDRMGVSYVRIKQIEEAAIKKIKQSTTLEMFQH